MVSGFGRTAFALEWFRGKGLRESPEGDAWWEYSRTTADLPDANLWAAWEMGRPAHRRSWALQIGRLAAMTRWCMDKDGVQNIRILIQCSSGGNFGFEGFMGLYKRRKRKLSV